MTSSEMIILFEERYNLSSNTNDGKTNDEILLYLNLAVDYFIGQRANLKDRKNYSFETTERGIDDLRSLITTSSLTKQSDISEYSNGAVYNTPSDYRYGMSGHINLNGNWYPCDRVNTEESKDFINNSINTPIIDKPKLFFVNPTSFVVLYDSITFNTITDCRLVYIKNPAIISNAQDSDLPSHTHNEIVELAVMIAATGVENYENFQAQTALKQNT